MQQLLFILGEWFDVPIGCRGRNIAGDDLPTVDEKIGVAVTVGEAVGIACDTLALVF